MKTAVLFLLIFLPTFSFSTSATAQEPISFSAGVVVDRDRYWNMSVFQWRTKSAAEAEAEVAVAGGDSSKLQFSSSTGSWGRWWIIAAAGSLSFLAASLSSAGGIGGGGLFIPILPIVVGLDLKAASSFSALMVTGGSIANVITNVFKRRHDDGGAHNNTLTLIDYDIALLSEPCMLLGSSIGVICNIIFPEWLITIMFAIFLAWSTFKTFKFGLVYWNLESQEIHSSTHMFENVLGLGETSDIYIREESQGGDLAASMEQHPLLVKESHHKLEFIPWGKLGVLAIIWFSFCLLYLLRGSRYGQGIIPIQSCGAGYWIISAAQIPLAIISTSWILYKRESICKQQVLGYDTKKQGPDEKLIFPVMAFLAGVLGGVFGIGGGMLISPLLLQVGIAPGVTAATCSFMVFFSSTMSAFQYILLGMDHIEAAIMFAVACFAGSIIGLVIVQRAIEKHGRASLIVFSVGLVMALSTVLMTSFGAVDVWKEYKNGKYMEFKKSC